MLLSSCMFWLRWLRFGKKLRGLAPCAGGNRTPPRVVSFCRGEPQTCRMGTRASYAQDYRAPCPPKASSLAQTRLVGTAHASPERVEWECQRRAHPTRLCIALSKKYRPLFRLWARGSPLLPLFRLPRDRGGWRADKAQCPDYSGRGVRITPDDGCTCVHPRLAARQRGILAFMPLTVVGPGRLLVADEAARVRPGDKGCVSPLLAGAAPVPRLTERLR